MAFDVGNFATGALSGAATGAAFGTPGIIAGGVLGGASTLFGKKKKKKPKRISTLDPQQQQLYNQYIGSLRGEGPFSDLYNYDAEGANTNFDQNVARPEYRNWQENVIPGVTGAFRKGNLQNSTYAADALARSGRDVQEKLSGLRSKMQFEGRQQAQQNRQTGINNILGMSTFAYNEPDSNPSGIDKILGQVAPSAGKWFDEYLTGLRNKANAPVPASPGAP